MLQTIFGILLLVAPFVAVFFYPIIKESLLKIILYTSIFHLSVSIISQAFHMFTYPVVASCHAVFVIFIINKAYLNQKVTLRGYISKVWSCTKSALKEHWLFVVVIAIIFFQLFSIYHSYTGTVQTLRGQKQVSDNKYELPFVSDEWITIAHINYSISQATLPVTNPLDHNRPFPNVLFAFPSLLAELFLVTGLNPLTYYTLFSVIFGLLLCSSVYVLLKKYGIHSYIAAGTLLFLPYIANSGNLPALWALLPFTIGTIFLLWQLVAQKFGNYKLAAGYMVLAIIIYPPMIVFALPAFLFNRLKLKQDIKDLHWSHLIPLAVCFIISIVMYFVALKPFGISFTEIFSHYIVRPNPDSGIVSYMAWKVLPLYVVILAVVGLYKAVRIRFKDIVVVSAIGILYWILYAFVNKVFFIEYPRIVVITSIFLVILVGITGEWFAEFISIKIKIRHLSKNIISLGLGSIAVVVSLILLSSYGVYNQSSEFPLKLTDEAGNTKSFAPAAAANRYLIVDDVRLFEKLRGETFIAPPWKALVIAVATHNYPLETKASTITNNFFSYGKFLSYDCEGKNKAADFFRITYVYSEEFSCPRFRAIGSTNEGLNLYGFVPAPLDQKNYQHLHLSPPLY